MLYSLQYYWKTCNCAYYSKCGLTSTEQSGRTTSEVLPIFCLMLHRITSVSFVTRVYSCFIFNVVSTCTTRSFSEDAFQLGSPQHVLVPGALFPQVQDFAILVEFNEIPASQPVGTPLDGSMSLWHISHTPILCHEQTCCGYTLLHHLGH